MSYKLRSIVCENCIFFKRHLTYKTDGICEKDNEAVREYQVCNKLPTNTEKSNTKTN